MEINDKIVDNYNDEEDIKRKACDKIREKHEKLRTTLKKLKEEFKRKNENKDLMKSMMRDFMREMEEFKNLIQLLGNFLYIPKEIISFIEEFKEPQDFLIQERLNLIQKYEVYEKKRKNFEGFALEMRKAMI